MTSTRSVRTSTAVADPFNPDNVLKPNADGSINVGSSAGVAANTQITGPAGANPIPPQTAAGADGATNVANVLPVRSYDEIWNGTSWDRLACANTASRIPSSAATNNATSAKAASGKVFQIDCLNTNAAVRYLKLYDKASAPSPASDNALLKAVIVLGATQRTTVAIGGALGLYFATGIAYALVTGSSDTDNTSVGAGDILGLNITYA